MLRTRKQKTKRSKSSKTKLKQGAGLARYNAFRSAYIQALKEKGDWIWTKDLQKKWKKAKRDKVFKKVPTKHIEDYVFSLIPISQETQYIQGRKSKHQPGFDWFDIHINIPSEIHDGLFNNTDIITLNLEQLGLESAEFNVTDVLKGYHSVYPYIRKKIKEIARIIGKKDVSPPPRFKLIDVTNDQINQRDIYEYLFEFQNNENIEAAKVPITEEERKHAERASSQETILELKQREETAKAEIEAEKIKQQTIKAQSEFRTKQLEQAKEYLRLGFTPEQITSILGGGK